MMESAFENNPEINFMDDRLVRIEKKLDVIIDRISAVDVTLASQHQILNEHQRRSIALEAIVDVLRRNQYRVEGVLKFFGILAVIATIVEGTTSLLNYIRK